MSTTITATDLLDIELRDVEDRPRRLRELLGSPLVAVFVRHWG